MKPAAAHSAVAHSRRDLVFLAHFGLCRNHHLVPLFFRHDDNAVSVRDDQVSPVHAVAHHRHVDEAVAPFVGMHRRDVRSPDRQSERAHAR